MKAQDIKQALNVLSKLEAGKISVLKGYIEIDFDRKVIRNNSLDHMVEYRNEDMEGFGIAVVDLKAFKKFVNKLKDEVFIKRVYEKNVRVVSGIAEQRLKVSEKPTCDRLDVKRKRSQHMPFADLKELFNRVSSCVARDDYRVILNGISFDKEKIAASDGHRLLAVNNPIKITKPFILMNPADILKPIKGDEAKVRVGAKFLNIEVDDYSITSSFIDGEFPPWRRTIPEDRKLLPPIHLNMDDMAITKSIIDMQAGFHFDRDETVTVYAVTNGSFLSGAQVRVRYTGERPKFDNTEWIGLNINYFNELLTTMDDPEIRFGETNSIAVVLGSDDIQGLIMPLKLSHNITHPVEEKVESA